MNKHKATMSEEQRDALVKMIQDNVFYAEHHAFTNEENAHFYHLHHIKKMALNAIGDGDVVYIAASFFMLGEAVERVLSPPSEDFKELYRVKLQKLKSEMPLKLYNQYNHELKEIAQGLAREYWNLDTKKELKLVDMCHKVWGFFVDRDVSLPLNDAIGLKPWLRPVGREFGYPCMRGRPKSKK